MSYYLILKNVEVSQANALSSNYAITAAPLMAINGFAHNMGLKIGCQADGVAMIHHDASFLAESDMAAGFKRPQFQQRKASTYIDKNDYVGSTMALSLQPVATINLKLSLVIEFSSKPDLARVKKFLHDARIAGSNFLYSSVDAFHESDEAFFDAIPGNGFWLIDRADLLVGNNPIEQLVTELGKRPKADDEISNSWLTPVVPAYALTTEPVDRVTGVRNLSDDTYPAHAYAEPLLGLAQYVSLREFEGDSIPFWRGRWIENTVFALSTSH